jgi:hypothetical protein
LRLALDFRFGSAAAVTATADSFASDMMRCLFDRPQQTTTA